MTEYAKQVYDLDCGIVDRTLTEHPFGVYDVDVRAPTLGKAQNFWSEDRTFWIYWGTAKTMKKAESNIKRDTKTLKKELGEDVQVRIVNSETGEVLKVITKL